MTNQTSRLQGKTAVITGAAGVIGLAAARLFIDEGARVLLVDVDDAALELALEDLRADSASYAVADVTQAVSVQRYVNLAVERYGGIDIFLNNAGIEGVSAPIPSYPEDVFDQVMAVNVRGVWLGLKYVIPAMTRRGGGSIVITSSISGLRAFGSGISPYVTSKHAVVGLMRAAALECAPLNIRVNTIHPGPIESRMMRALEEARAPGAPAKVRAAIARTIPLGRYGVAEDVAQLMLFLASDESRFCTGGVYPVDGGGSAC